MGVDLLDGDSFIPFTDSYGTRTWWFREYEAICCPPWGFFDTDLHVTGVGTVRTVRDLRSDCGQLAESLPAHTTIASRFREASDVGLEVFDLQGRQVASREFGVMPPGSPGRERSATRRCTTGVYMYRLLMSRPNGGPERATLRERCSCSSRPQTGRPRGAGEGRTPSPSARARDRSEGRRHGALDVARWGRVCFAIVALAWRRGRRWPGRPASSPAASPNKRGEPLAGVNVAVAAARPGGVHRRRTGAT